MTHFLTKFVIFATISVVLLAAIYSSNSGNYGLAQKVTECSDTAGIGKVGGRDYMYVCCQVTKDDKGSITSAECFTVVCSKDVSGRDVKCVAAT
jgi:hypothetical protein